MIDNCLEKSFASRIWEGRFCMIDRRATAAPQPEGWGMAKCERDRAWALFLFIVRFWGANAKRDVAPA